MLCLLVSHDLQEDMSQKSDNKIWNFMILRVKSGICDVFFFFFFNFIFFMFIYLFIFFLVLFQFHL